MINRLTLCIIWIGLSISCNSDSVSLTQQKINNNNDKKIEIRDGYYESHYDNGQLWSTSEYKNGK